MFGQSPEPLLQAARLAMADDALAAAVRTTYRYADAAIARRRPACHQCARCCRFDRYGHNLFVSTAEVALFLRSTDLARIAAPIAGSCPFLRTDPARCAARRDRPLGCRLYYCDPSAQWWQQDLYNTLHGRLRQLHASFHVPYFYAEWLAVLRAAVTSAAPALTPSAQSDTGANHFRTPS
jgi:hypothetical protein